MITLQLPRFAKLGFGPRVVAASAFFWLMQAAASAWAIPHVGVDIAPIFILPPHTSSFPLSSPASEIQVDGFFFNPSMGSPVCPCRMSYTFGSLTSMSVSEDEGIYTVNETYGPGGSLVITTGTGNLNAPFPLYPTTGTTLFSGSFLTTELATTLNPDRNFQFLLATVTGTFDTFFLEHFGLPSGEYVGNMRLPAPGLGGAIDLVPTQSVPEPSSLALLTIGLLGLIGLERRFRLGDGPSKEINRVRK